MTERNASETMHEQGRASQVVRESLRSTRRARASTSGGVGRGRLAQAGEATGPRLGVLADDDPQGIWWALVVLAVVALAFGPVL